MAQITVSFVPSDSAEEALCAELLAKANVERTNREEPLHADINALFAWHLGLVFDEQVMAAKQRIVQETLEALRQAPLSAVVESQADLATLKQAVETRADAVRVAPERPAGRT